jgi:hypothetical protein
MFSITFRKLSPLYRFFFCELLNFVNVLGQIYFMDLFLGGEFTTYGRDVVRMTEADPDLRTDPMSRVFPKVRNTEADPDLRTDPMSRVFPKVRNTEADPDLRTDPMSRVFPKVRNTEADPDLRTDPCPGSFLR